MTTPAGVSFVIPVLNGRRWLADAIAAIAREAAHQPHEILIVEDGSTDGSRRLLRRLERDGRVRVVDGQERGAAAAINVGIREARFPVICQVDQDVIVQPGWLERLLDSLSDPDVAAVQGHYVTAENAGFWARVMGRDLEDRYAGIATLTVDHVCTGNTAYRASALRQVGLLDEQFGYGYDNDLSYRLTAAGYRLVIRHDARSTHRWRDDLAGYVKQQFGVGYGRIDVVARHPRRAAGDDVSGTMMMMHGPFTLAAIVSIVIGAAGGAAWVAAGAAVFGALAIERAVAGVRAWHRTGDAAALAFPVAHALRDLAWAAAIVAWIARRATRRSARPSHSMLRRDARLAPTPASLGQVPPRSLLAILPAFNEAENLPAVVAELRRVIPGLDLLVVNDGSTDRTAELLPALAVRWLALPSRLGVGGAVRAGIRYALREGYTHAVRVDADGQHRPHDIARLLQPVLSGRAEAAIGSRFLDRRRGTGSARRLGQAALGVCLTLLTGQRITDPTSGFWLFGPRAMRLLARHHPGGYSEPELVLFLSRNRVRVTEVPIRMRPRRAGRTSLTPARALVALARTALAMVVVPFRAAIEGSRGE